MNSSSFSNQKHKPKFLSAHDIVEFQKRLQTSETSHSELLGFSQMPNTLTDIWRNGFLV